MFFNSQKYSSSETRRPENSSPSSLLHRCSKFRPFSCSAAPPIFQESRKSNRGEPSSALTNFQGNGSEIKPTSFRAAASWSCRFLEKARKRVLDLLFRLLPCQLLLMYPKEMFLKARKRVLDLLFLLLLACQLLMMCSASGKMYRNLCHLANGKKSHPNSSVCASARPEAPSGIRTAQSHRAGSIND